MGDIVFVVGDKLPLAHEVVAAILSYAQGGSRSRVLSACRVGVCFFGFIFERMELVPGTKFRVVCKIFPEI